MNPQMKIQEVLLERVRAAEAERDLVRKEASEKMGMYMKEYNKLNRRFELLVARKRVDMKKPGDYTWKEHLTELVRMFGKLFRRQS